MTREESLPKTVHLSRSKLLLYLYNNLNLCKRKILPNLWQLLRQHKYKQVDQIEKESKKSMSELLGRLLEQYKVEVAKPILDSIENNIYMGRYDFSDSATSTSNFKVFQAFNIPSNFVINILF
jgi:hypothetical protein